MPRLLGLDIETAPALVYTWGLHDQNIGIEQVVKPSRILCWAAKWFGEKGVMYADERSGKRKMLSRMRDLLTEADAVVTYNGNAFDLQKLDGEFVFHRILPAPPVISIDLYKTVRGLGYISGKLAFVGPHLKIGEKIKHEGFALWRACLAGDKQAWTRMEKYNKQDAVMLEGLYEVLRPYMKNHPRIRPPQKVRPDYECMECGEVNGPRQARGSRYTKTQKYLRIQCLSCGSWGEGKREPLYPRVA